MSCLESLVRDYLAAREQVLQPPSGNRLTAASVLSFFPQTWVLITEQETLAIHVDATGKITVQPRPVLVRDGAVTIRHDVLADSLRHGKPPPPYSYQVSFYTDNGKAAFEQVARYFGL